VWTLVTASPTTRLLGSAVTTRRDGSVDSSSESAADASSDSSAALLSRLPRPTGSVCFVRGGHGLVGWGEHARYTTTGSGAAGRIQEWFDEVRAGLRVSDPIGEPGTGPVAFVSLGFEDSDVAVAVIPQVVVGRSAAGGFVTRIGAAGPAASSGPPPVPVRTPGRISYADADLSVAGFTTAVAAATERIRRGELDKVVLAHDLVATADRPVDERLLLRRLAAAYPGCWTFDVEGLVGASPELLIRRQGRLIASRVLAGTAWPEHVDDAVASGLLHSSKDVAEHAYAVRSVSDVLAPVCDELDVPTRPAPLELANLTHLSTDITGRLGDFTPTALELAARLHPTAAVGGSPTDTARQVIRELEPMSRGRYAAPVGWVDGRGDGEFAIALRCAQVNGRSVRLLAGCGIVADSEPETEAREAQIKMIPIRDALESAP
jgi:menaquinone-specific isochorismate synthase